MAVPGMILSARAEPLQIVVLGDSLAAGYGLGPGDGFTDKLQAALRARGHDVAVANAGVSGDTSSGGLSRLDWSVPDGTGLVILELGANDMLRGISPDITEKNLDAMLARLQARNIAVLLAGMRAAPNLGPDYQKAFDGLYPRLAEAHGVPRESSQCAALSVLSRRRRRQRRPQSGRRHASQRRRRRPDRGAYPARGREGDRVAAPQFLSYACAEGFPAVQPSASPAAFAASRRKGRPTSMTSSGRSATGRQTARPPAMSASTWFMLSSVIGPP